MATTGGTIKPIAPGDDISVDRVITGVPTSIAVVSASMGLKRNRWDTTVIPEIPLKTITTTDTPGTGWIVNAGSLVPPTTGVWTVEVRFDFTDVQTALLTPGHVYSYFVFVETADGKDYTAELGTWAMLSGSSSG